MFEKLELRCVARINWSSLAVHWCRTPLSSTPIPLSICCAKEHLRHVRSTGRPHSRCTGATTADHSLDTKEPYVVLEMKQLTR